MNRKKLVAIILAIALGCGGVVGVSAAVRRTTGGNAKVMVIPASELNYGYGYWDSESLEGYVTSDTTQNITLNETQSVSEVKVTEGQQVKKGDVLLVYDMKQTKVNLEKEELNLERIKMSIQSTEEKIAKLKKTTPVSDSDEDDDEGFDDFDDEDEEDEEPEEELEQPKAAIRLDGDTKPYYSTDEDAGEPGSETNPYRFLCLPGATVTPDFINMIKKLQEKKESCYFVLELREDGDWEGNLIRSWMQNAADVLSVDREWLGIIDPDDERPIIPTKTAEEIEELEEKIEKLEKEIEKLTDAEEIEKLKKKITELEAECERLRDQIDNGTTDTPAVTPTPEATATPTPEATATPTPEATAT
ncbi:MAG: biotin/lipoyl-binding protein, partial [Eubacterium sp.]|nr:biotin/lipoyl-binding protein [Eubacterium sp.]